MAKAIGTILLIAVALGLIGIAVLTALAFSGHEAATWIAGLFLLFLGLPSAFVLIILTMIGLYLRSSPQKPKQAVSPRIEPSLHTRNTAEPFVAPLVPAERLLRPNRNHRTIGWIAIAIGAVLCGTSLYYVMSLHAITQGAANNVFVLTLLFVTQIKTLLGIGAVLFGLAEFRHANALVPQH